MTGRVLARSALALVATIAAGLFLAACSPAPTMLTGHLTVTGSGADAVGVEVVVYSSSTTTLAARTVTDATGHYSFDERTLPSGTYRIRFSDADWWSGATSWDEATDVPVAPNAPATINESLIPATGSITGTVTDQAAAPIAGVAVVAYTESRSIPAAATTTGGDGTYALSPLPTGSYRLQFSKAGLTTRFANSATNLLSAPITTVAAGTATTGVDTTLLPEVQLGGYLYIGGYQTVSPTGTPIASPSAAVSGIEVRAFDTATHTSVTLVTSGDNEIGDGYFLFEGLNPGSYTLSITDPAGVYSDLYPATVFTEAAGGGAFVGAFQMQTRTCMSLQSVLPAGTNLAGAQLQGCNVPVPDFTNTDLTGADLSYSRLNVADFSHSTLDGASLAYASGHGKFIGTSLIGAQLPHTEFLFTDFTDADLTGANFSQSVCKWSILTGAAVDDAQLQGTEFTGLISGDMTGNPAAGPPVVRGYLLARSVVATGADLSNADLAGADLSSADLTGANLTNDDLRAVNLSGAQLRGATVTGSNLSNATNLNRVRASSLVGTPAAVPTGWRVTQGSLVGLSTDLTDADLTGADLSGLDLSGAFLRNTTLTNANLSGTKLAGATVSTYTVPLEPSVTLSILSGGITGTPSTMISGWKLHNGWLVGQGANLTGADLTGLVFWNADLYLANLTGANLTGASLLSAKLISVPVDGANFTNAVLSGSIGTTGGSTAIYANTTCSDGIVVTSPQTCVGHGWNNP